MDRQIHNVILDICYPGAFVWVRKLFSPTLLICVVDLINRHSLIKTWELMYLCASCMPPSKEIGGYLSEYVHTVAHNSSNDSEVQVFAMNTLNALKRSGKAGPRHIIPGREEIEAVLTGRKLTTIVFFLDETFEEITYDMATTVADAVEVLFMHQVHSSHCINFSIRNI